MCGDGSFGGTHDVGVNDGVIESKFFPVLFLDFANIPCICVVV